MLEVYMDIQKRKYNNSNEDWSADVRILKGNVYRQDLYVYVPLDKKGKKKIYLP